MRIRFLKLLICLSSIHCGVGQVFDDFSDGEILNDPLWSGDQTDFEVSNDHQLHLVATEAGSSFVATSSNIFDKVVWEFYLHMDFNPSSSNYAKIYLMSDQPDLEGSLNGYYLVVGDTEDEISLYRQEGTTSTYVIDGVDGLVATTPQVRIKVIRDQTGRWSLYHDLLGGDQYVYAGTAIDNDPDVSSTHYSGFVCNYTVTRADKFYFDDIIVDQLRVDTLIVKNDTAIEVQLNQYLLEPEASDISAFSIPGYTILEIQKSMSDSSRFTISLDPVTPLQTGDHQLQLGTGLTLNDIEEVSFNYTKLKVDTVQIISDTEVVVDFNVNLDPGSSEDMNNFFIDQGVGQPVSANINPSDHSQILMSLNESLNDGILYEISATDIFNESLNSNFTGTSTFTFIVPLIIEQVEILSTDSLFLTFNKAIDPQLAINISNYTVNQGIGHPESVSIGIDDQSIYLVFDHPFQESTYVLEVNHLEDLEGYEIAAGSNISFSYLPMDIYLVSQFDFETISVHFNQKVAPSSGEDIGNYIIPGIGNPTNSAILELNDSIVHLTFPELVNSTYQLVVNGVKNDIQNATLTLDTTHFSFEKPTPFRAVQINEIMADFSPSAGLPEAEYIELYNPGTHSIELEGFLLNGEPIPAVELGVNEYLILTDDSNLGLFDDESTEYLSSFDALTNGGDSVILRDQFGYLVDSVFYSTSWYRDSEKDDGGYALEQINSLVICSDGSNWIASMNQFGGTPGKINSVANSTPDMDGPSIISLEVITGDTLLISFNEPILSGSLTPEKFSISSGGVIEIEELSYRDFKVILDQPLPSEQIHDVVVVNISDCQGNTSSEDSISFYFDATAPILKDLTIISDHEIALIFHEPLRESLSEREENYFLDQGYGIPESAILQDSALHRVQVTFDSTFQVGQTYQISISLLTDTLGNTVDSFAVAFEFLDQVDSVYSTAPNLVYIQFAESLRLPVEKTSFMISKEIGFPAIVDVDQDDSRIVRLGFEKNLKPNTAYTLFVKDLISSETSESLVTPSKSLIYDTRAPRIERLLIPNDSQIVIQWDEPIKLSSAFSSILYELVGIGFPIDISAIDQQQIKLTFEFMIPGEEELELKVNGIEDLFGNKTGTITKSLIYDHDPPVIEKAVVLDHQTLLLLISEKLDSSTIFQPDHYAILGESPVDIQVIGPDSLSIQLQFSDIPVGVDQVISISGLVDNYGNQMDSTIILFNSLNPIVSDIVFLSDSCLQLLFSRDMSSSIYEMENYQSNRNFSSIDHISQNSVKIVLEEGLFNQDSLIIYFHNLEDKDGNDLITESASIAYNTYFDSWKLIDAKTLELTFRTSFGIISSDQFLLQGINPSLIQKDGDDKSVIRLGFSDSLTTDSNINLSIANLTDLYERRIPDQQVPILIDRTPPQVLTIESDYFHQVHLTFNETLSEASTSMNHFVIQSANIIEISKSGEQMISISFDSLVDLKEYKLMIHGVSDLAGNILINDTVQFTYQIPFLPHSGDILITEIMVDPSPSVGLPEVEYVELFNASDKVIQLKSLKLSDASKQVSLPEYEISPGSYVVLSGEITLESGIYVPGLPAFDNTADSITVSNINDDIIDQVVYTRDWYGDTEKDDGGYSLELINPQSDCPGIINWKASVSSKGGTPGEINSVFSLDPDIESPTLINYSLSERSITLTFSERLDSLSLATANYTIEGIGIKDLVVSDNYADQVVINFTESPENGRLYQLRVDGPKDCSGNLIEPFTISFGQGRSPKFNDIIITEIMADPDPIIGLPNSEYLEIYNRTDELISLKDVRLKDATGEVALPAVTLHSNQYLILVPNGSLNQFAEFHEVIGVSGWRSLSNQGESLSLFHDQELIFNLDYSDSWHTEEVDGGISLEMKDINNPCGGANNWSSSISVLGGTPGEVNSAVASIPDNFGPELINVEVLSSDSLKICFDEQLMFSEVSIDQLEILPGPIPISQILMDTTDRDFLIVKLSALLEPNIDYEVKVNQVVDCNGNFISGNNRNFILPEPSDSMDIVINEVLFNPKGDGVDFVEVYNRSNKNINLVGWKLGRQFEDVIASLIVTENSYILRPSEYLAFTADPIRIKRDYPNAQDKRIFQMTSLVQYPNETAKIVLQNNQDQIIDAFEYHEDMHLSFLESVDGVSLERISMDKPTQDRNNWQSASGTVGYATPGYENSQSLESKAAGVLSIEPKVFIPANHGVNLMQDFTTINYQFNQTGTLANINIYNRNGQLIKSLANGITLATNGFFKWDGTTDIGSTATIGHYLIVFEVYDQKGQREIMKETVVVGQ